MGYRNKIAILSIEKHNEIKDKTYEELAKECGEGDYVGCYQLADEVYEVGKYWDHDFLDQFKKDIFTNADTNEHFNEDGEFYIIGKEGLKAIIESYHKKVVDYYKSVVNPDPKDVQLGLETTPKQHVERQLSEWDSKFMKPYNLDSKSDRVVTSWQYEYAIFELVRIYKSIDDSTQLVCLTGW